MIIDLTKNYTPESYVDSRDYRVFLRLLSALVTVFKYNADNLPDLYIPSECPVHMLPLLASMVGYKYNDEKTSDNSRIIITYFPYLIRNRGSELGIKLAAALSINTTTGVDRYYSTSQIIVEADVENGLINIYYPRVNDIDWTLIEVVRPVGMRVNYIQSDFAGMTEESDIKVTVRYQGHHEFYDQSDVEKSRVGYDSNRDVISRGSKE